MRVLLDECLPRRLKSAIRGHTVQTVPEAGWAGNSNADLLSLASEKFDVFVTVDQNITAQQDPASVALCVVILRARTNRLQDLEPLIEDLLLSLETIRPGEVVSLRA